MLAITLLYMKSSAEKVLDFAKKCLHICCLRDILIIDKA